MYNIKYSLLAVKNLNKLDKVTEKMITSWIENKLKKHHNPKILGVQLKGTQNELWRFRVGKYRIIAKVDEVEICILVINIGHRGKIYKNF